MVIDGRFRVAAPPERVLENLFDARLMAECLPGCEALEALADDRYRAVVVVSLAGIKARFDLQVEVTERRPDGIRALTRGEEGGNASRLTATSEVRLDAADAGTHVAYTSEVSVTGRLGRFALGMMKKKAQAMGDEFAANLQRRLSDAPSSTAAPATVQDAASTAAPAAPSDAVPTASSVVALEPSPNAEPVVDTEPKATTPPVIADTPAASPA